MRSMLVHLCGFALVTAASTATRCRPAAAADALDLTSTSSPSVPMSSLSITSHGWLRRPSAAASEAADARREPAAVPHLVAGD